MSAYRLDDSEDLGGLTPEWEDLADRARAGPFSRPGWLAAWWNAFGSGRLRVLTVREARNGRLRGVLPVRERFGALSSPTNWHSPEFGLLADHPEASGLLLTCLLRRRPRRISLAFLEEEQAAQVQAAAAARGYRVIRRTLLRAPYVSLGMDWADYEALMDRKVRSELGRRGRRLQGRGRVSLEVSSGERLDALLEEGFQVEESGWKGERGTAIRSQRATRRFYTEVARWAGARGWLRLALLRLDGRPLAFDLCLEHEGVHYLLKTGYDPEYRELGPGKLLRHRMLARAFRAGLVSYEFLGDAWPWKLEWTRTTRTRELVQGFCPSTLGVVDWSTSTFARPLAKRVRDLVRGPTRGVATGAGHRP